MKQTILTIIVACVMLTSCNNVKPLITAPDIPTADIPKAPDIPTADIPKAPDIPEEHPHEPILSEDFDVNLAMLAPFAAVAVPLALLLYFVSTCK